jgi:hypothetical protein
MAKVITTIASEDGMDFEEIMSFKTENYIGIWDAASERFALLLKSGIYFEPYHLDTCDDLRELDDQVFNRCEEHIIEVFDQSCYSIVLD